jgi:hypothetical protein
VEAVVGATVEDRQEKGRISVKWSEVESMPTTLSTLSGLDVHESCFRSFHVLKNVESMLLRGDSRETILEAIDRANVTPKKEWKEGK